MTTDAADAPDCRLSWFRLWARTALFVAILPVAIAPVAADDARELALGRHLARECVSCHRVDGGTNGIPSITGWPADTFVTTMGFYRDKARPNPVMVSVAQSLSPEETRALAIYFATLERRR